MVSVITVNYNGIDDTRQFLSSFRHAVTTACEVIVVDNGSVQNEAAILSREFDWIKPVRSDENLGFAGGNNLGIKAASGNFLLFINNDVLVSSDFIPPLIDCLSEDKAGAVSPEITYPDGSLCYGGCYPLGRSLIKIRYIATPGFSQKTITPLAHGAAMMVKREAIERVGGWPEEYFLYSEEIDWSLAIRRAGYQIWYQPQSSVCHVGSRTTGRQSPLKYYYNTRNRFLLYRRNLKGSTRLLSVLYELAIAVPKRCLGLILSGQAHLLRPVCYGVIDAMRGRFGRRRY